MSISGSMTDSRESVSAHALQANIMLDIRDQRCYLIQEITLTLMKHRSEGDTHAGRTFVFS